MIAMKVFCVVFFFLVQKQTFAFDYDDLLYEYEDSIVPTNNTSTPNTPSQPSSREFDTEFAVKHNKVSRNRGPCLSESELIRKLLVIMRKLVSSISRKKTTKPKKTITLPPTTATPQPTTTPTATTTHQEREFAIQDEDFEDSFFDKNIGGSETTIRNERDHPNPYGPVNWNFKIYFCF